MEQIMVMLRLNSHLSGKLGLPTLSQSLDLMAFPPLGLSIKSVNSPGWALYRNWKLKPIPFLDFSGRWDSQQDILLFFVIWRLRKRKAFFLIPSPFPSCRRPKESCP